MDFYALLRKIAQKCTRRVEFKFALPTEDAPVIVTNHTGISAPAMFLIHYPQRLKTWSHFAFTDKRLTIEHLKNNVLTRRRSGFLLYLPARIFLPVIVWFFRKIDPIPVWRGSRKITETLEKSSEAKEEGFTQVIFPEKLNESEPVLVNPYLYELNRGFVYAMKEYYERTGKIMKFYPAYSCPALKTVSVGEPIAYNPDLPMRLQKETVCSYLEEKIHALARALPPHKIVLPVKIKKENRFKRSS